MDWDSPGCRRRAPSARSVERSGLVPLGDSGGDGGATPGSSPRASPRARDCAPCALSFGGGGGGNTATSWLETLEQPGSAPSATQPFEWPTLDPQSPLKHEKSSPISQSLNSAKVVISGSVVISGHTRVLPAAAAATGRPRHERQLIADAYAGIGGDDGRMNVDEPGPKPAQVLQPSEPAPTPHSSQLRWLATAEDDCVGPGSPAAAESLPDAHASMHHTSQNANRIPECASEHIVRC